MQVQLRKKIEEILSSGRLSTIIESDDFYFQKAKDILENLKKNTFSDDVKSFLLENRKSYALLKHILDDDPDIGDILQNIFSLIAYCDTKAYRKNLLNKYPDKRVLALAYVRMNFWTDQIISYIFGEVIPDGSIKNAIEYLENPSVNFTMLSENHRSQLSENLFEKSYDKDSFTENYLNFFSELSIAVKNPENYTHILSRIAYLIEEEWKESIIGILGGDGTGWQDEVVKSNSQLNYITLWNHRKPNDPTRTLKLLEQCIEENGHYKIFYSSDHKVRYIAEVISFVTNQNELSRVNWQKEFGNIEWYKPNFAQYNDKNGERLAKIVYLANKFYAVDPIPANQFKYLLPSGYPSVGSQTPIVSYTSNQEILKKKQMENYINLLKYKKQIILQGPPGTGKTKEAKELAKELITKNHLNSQTILVKHLTKDFIKTTLQVAQKLNGKNGKEFEIISLEKNVVIIKSGTSQPWRPSYNKIIDSFNNQLWLIKGRTGGFKSYEDAIAKYLYEKHYEAIESFEEKVEKIEDFLILIQFHPSYTYEDFVRGIVAKPNSEGEGIIYEAENKTLAAFSEKALNDPENNYVLIIDEINRANLSSVLGELIYALEYRGEQVESMYEVDGKSELILPPNLYIIGTMNTADRSVGHIDYAIRRRFAFVDILPKDLSDDQEIKFHLKLFNQISGLFISNLTEYFDNRETSLIRASTLSSEFRPEDVWLGHSYFIQKKIKSDDDQEIFEPTDFSIRLEHEIKPILMEYVKDGILIHNEGQHKIETIIRELKVRD